MAFVLLRYSWLQHLLLSLLALPREGRLQRLPYADATSEGRFVLYLERHRARDKAFLGGGIVQAARDVLIRAGRELGVRPQRDAFELPSAGRLLDLHAGGAVAICYYHDTGVGAKVQVPELMAGGKRGDKQLRRIPSRRIAAEHRAGRAGYGRFALRADLVRTRIGAVRRRAGALIAGPVRPHPLGVTLDCPS